MGDMLKLELNSVRSLTDRIREAVFARADGGSLPAYVAGAHLKFQTPAGERSYSLVNLSHGDAFGEPENYRFAVQLEPDSAGGSRHMHGMQVGDTIEATLPHNDFPLEPQAPALLIAGGIGVTPIISMAQQLKQTGTPFRFHYAARSEASMAWHSELLERFGEVLHLHFDDDPQTKIDLASLAGSVTGDEHVYVCGPKGMIEAVRAAAEEAGIGAERIHVELFETPAPQGDDAPFEVVVHSTGETFQIPPGKTIIEVLEEGGVDLVYDCQRGDCGICQTEIIEGVPDHRDVVLSDAEKQAGDVMQICVSRAKSARLVLDL